MQVNIDKINPYIRRATHYILKAPFRFRDSVFFDYALIYVVDGICDIVLENVRHRCGKGQIILIPPGVKKRLSCVENTDLVQAYVSFDLVYDEFSGQRYINQRRTMEELSADEIRMIGKNIFANDDVLLFEEKDYRGVVTKLYKLIEMYKKNTAYATLKSKGLLCEILGDLLIDRVECVSKKPSIIVYSAQKIPIIEQIRDYIDSNYANQITLEHISSVFYINKYTLIRQFKKEYGVSVMQYVNSLKLRSAKGLLSQKKMSIADISAAIGFDSIYSFSRFFKKHMGISPKKYQENDI